jgi:acetoin utilization protein AcuB
MKTRVETLDVDDTLDLAEDIMNRDRIRHLPVVDGGRVVGVVSQRDLFQRGLAAALGYGEIAQRKLLHALRAKEVMSAPAVTVSPNLTLEQAGRTMLHERIGCLPVVDDGRLVGILTESDVMRELIGRSVGFEILTTK